MPIERASINPDLLVWARESLNLSTEEAARRLHISETRLLEWENGVVQPTINQLREASRVYRRPLAAFYLPHPPEDFRVPHDYRRTFGSDSRPLSAEFLAEYRLAEYRRRLALELLEDTGESFCNLVRTARMSKNTERLADRLRETLGVGVADQMSWSGIYDALNGWRQSLESQSVLVFQFSGVDVNEVRGFAIAEKQYPVIGVNASDAPAARVFTMMHELAHIILGRSGISEVLTPAAETATQDLNVELYCNRLAAHILVPTRSMLAESAAISQAGFASWSESDFGRLADRFHVSRAVIIRRLYDVGQLDETSFRSMWLSYSKAQVVEAERSAGFVSVPKRAVRLSGKPFVRIVLDAYDQEQITSADVSEYLGIRLKHLPDVRTLSR